MAGHSGLPEAARSALADSRLRTNLRRATGTIRDKRLAVAAELEDWEELRETAAAIKRHTLRHLDHHLLRLEKAVTAAGEWSTGRRTPPTPTASSRTW